jgi:hypothetical protein
MFPNGGTLFNLGLKDGEILFNLVTLFNEAPQKNGKGTQKRTQKGTQKRTQNGTQKPTTTWTDRQDFEVLLIGS